MAEPVPVAELVAAALGGDEDAWTSLVQRYGSLVTAVGRRHRLTPSELADVSQTVWLTLLEKLPTLREPQALAGWLRTTTRNESIRVLRARRQQVPLDETVPGTDEPVRRSCWPWSAGSCCGRRSARCRSTAGRCSGP